MKYIIANWKAHFTITKTHEWLQKFSSQSFDNFTDTVEIILCPPLPYISLVSDMLYHPAIKIGAQNISAFSEGPYTGEVTASMLEGLVDFALIGHSERRIHCNENDEMLEKKCQNALANDIQPIYCVRGIEDRIPHTISYLAFEVMDAIGTGNNIPVPDVIAMKKKLQLEEKIKYIYGGSVSSTNAAEYLQAPDIDGVIVCGASLDPEEFFSIIKIANKAAQMQSAQSMQK